MASVRRLVDDLLVAVEKRGVRDPHEQLEYITDLVRERLGLEEDAYAPGAPRDHYHISFKAHVSDEFLKAISKACGCKLKDVPRTFVVRGDDLEKDGQSDLTEAEAIAAFKKRPIPVPETEFPVRLYYDGPDDIRATVLMPLKFSEDTDVFIAGVSKGGPNIDTMLDKLSAQSYARVKIGKPMLWREEAHDQMHGTWLKEVTHR
jgi:hypothetical protein